MPEKEYIEREAVCSKCKNKSHCEVSFDEKQKCPVYKAPTADVAEVKHGEWEVAIGYDPLRRVMCDNCHRMNFEPTAYCPCCGAKMDGKGG